MARVLVTGAGGFLGAAVVEELVRDGYTVRALVRERSRGEPFPKTIEVTVGDVRDHKAMLKAAAGCECVVHLAGKVHVLDEGPSDAGEYDEVNVGGTKNALEGAVAGGAVRFVFASSVKVFGETTSSCVDESAPPFPQTAYARSKWIAEQLVSEYGSSSRLTTVSLRLPMVYGPTKKGNFYRMISAIDRGWFPPLPQVRSVRSLLNVKNFVLAIRAMLQSSTFPKAMYIVTDAEPYSVTDLYDLLRMGLGLPPPRWRVPLGILSLGGWGGDIVQALLGRPVPLTSSTVEKLVGQAWYGPEALIRDLGYQPHETFEAAVPELIEYYRRSLS